MLTLLGVPIPAARIRQWVARGTLLAALAMGASCTRQAEAARQTGSTPLTLQVASDGEFLAFTPQDLTCPAGARVRVVFRHLGQRLPQEHNWVLTSPGTADAVAQAGTAAGAPNSFVPPGDRRVLATTPLCGRGGEVIVEFTAPAPGDYPFVCTFPGHAAEMHGVLHVIAR